MDESDKLVDLLRITAAESIRCDHGKPGGGQEQPRRDCNGVKQTEETVGIER